MHFLLFLFISVALYVSLKNKVVFDMYLIASFKFEIPLLLLVVSLALHVLYAQSSSLLGTEIGGIMWFHVCVSISF